MSRGLTSSRSLCHTLSVSHQHLVHLSHSLYVFDSLTFSGSFNCLSVSCCCFLSFFLSLPYFVSVSSRFLTSFTVSRSLLALSLYAWGTGWVGEGGGVGGEQLKGKRQKGTKHKEEGFKTREKGYQPCVSTLTWWRSYSFTRTHSLRYPLPPLHLVCARLSPPALALSLAPHPHPFLCIPLALALPAIPNQLFRSPNARLF